MYPVFERLLLLIVFSIPSLYVTSMSVETNNFYSTEFSFNEIEIFHSTEFPFKRISTLIEFSISKICF